MCIVICVHVCVRVCICMYVCMCVCARVCVSVYSFVLPDNFTKELIREQFSVTSHAILYYLHRLSRLMMQHYMWLTLLGF